MVKIYGTNLYGCCLWGESGSDCQKFHNIPNDNDNDNDYFIRP